MTDTAIEESNMRACSERVVRKSSDKLAKDVTAASEEALGVRECLNCKETLPLDSKHFPERYDIPGTFRARCRACYGRYNSWSERERQYAVRARISKVKTSREWVSARQTKIDARRFMSFYHELSETCWWAWDCGLSKQALGDHLNEIAELYGMVAFMQKNSRDFLAATEGDDEELDYPEMARTWQHYYRRWQVKAITALDTMDAILATLEAGQSA